MDRSIIKVYNPYQLKNGLKYVQEIINDNWISFSGKYVNECENYLQNKLSIKHVLLTNNGTSATHCIIKAIRWKYPECKKIYIPNHCFIAVYNSVLYEYAENNIEILPIDSLTWNLDLNNIELLDRNSAIVLVHNIGNIIPIEIIKEKRPDIILVEDNCEGFMGKHYNNFSGTQTLCSSISFFPNKHITSGEGGAFCTNDTELYHYIKKFCRQGITEIRYKHDILGQNYRMSNLNAALLYSQLELLDDIISKKKRIFDLYKNILSQNTNIIFQQELPNTQHSNWMFAIKFNKSFNFNKIKKYFEDNFIEIRQFFLDYRDHSHLKSLKIFKSINTKEKLENNIIILPSYPDLLQEDIEHICNVINNLII